MRVLLAAVSATVAVATGCSPAGSGAKPDVVASFYPLAWAAGQVAAPGVRVVNLTPPGAEPHDLELSPRDLETVRDARLVVYAGGGFQPSVEDAVASRDGPSLDVVREGEDPHVWLDPVRFAEVVEEIAAALGGEKGEEGRKGVEALKRLHTLKRAEGLTGVEALKRLHTPKRAEGLTGVEALKRLHLLERLDREYRRGLARCERRVFVTTHASFGALAARYGLTQLALAGRTPEAEPSPRDLERIVGQVRESGATTVFTEPLVSARLAETVAREAGIRVATLDPLEGLSQERLAAGEDYLSVMRDNLGALREALGCR